MRETVYTGKVSKLSEPNKDRPSDKIDIFKIRKPRYTENEIYLLNELISNKIDIELWNGDVIKVDREENLLSDIYNEYGEKLERVFNHIEKERIANVLRKLKEG